MKKANPTQIVYYPRDVVRGTLDEYAIFRDGLTKDDRMTSVKIALAITEIFRKFPTKLTSDFTYDLLQVRRNINSLEEELKLATDRKSIKAARKKYSLEYRELHDAKQKLTPELAEKCIEHCCRKFLEDVRNYKFVVLSQKNFIPRIEEGDERGSDSEEESSTKWRDRVGSSSSTSPASSLSSLGSKGSNDFNGSGSVRK